MHVTTVNLGQGEPVQIVCGAPNVAYESQSSRSDMKGILRQLEAMNPEARYSLWGSMTNVQEDLLPDKID